MFYFIYGDTPLPLKVEEQLREIKNENTDIPIKYFDGSQGEDEEKFLESVSTNSMFSPKELLVLRRAEKIKKLDKFLEVVRKYDTFSKIIVVTYEEELNDYDKSINPPGKKVLGVAEKLGKVIEARKATEKRGVQFYIERQLGISDREAEKLVEVIGNDFVKVKNEVEKIRNFIKEDTFILEKVLPILSVSEEYNLKKSVENMMKDGSCDKLLDGLVKNKEYQLFIYIMSEELNLALKIASLKKSGVIKGGVSYNHFKDRVYGDIKKYFRSSWGYMSEYPIFLKLFYGDRYSEEFILEKIEELLMVDYNSKNGNIDMEIGIERFIISFSKREKEDNR